MTQRSSLTHDLAVALDRIEQLEAIVDRLPKTADGVPVLIGYDSVWYGDQSAWLGPGEIEDHDDGEWLVYFHDKYISECYSTKEAAEAARKGDG